MGRYNIDEFKKFCKASEKDIICLDFDGVIHKNSKGFFDGTIYDEPIDNAIESIKYLYDLGFELVIYTCKANPKRPLINGLTGIELIWEWLNRYEVSQYIKDVTYIKPNAVCYIDDKGIKFNSWEQAILDLDKLEIKK